MRRSLIEAVEGVQKVEIPASLYKRIAEAFGTDAEAWMARFPDLLREKLKQWELVPNRLLNSGYSLVVDVTNEPTGSAVKPSGSAVEPPGSAILKFTYPNDETRSEPEALRAFAGRGCVGLLKEDVANGALLLEKISPGTSLLGYFNADRDEEATAIAAGLMANLRAYGEAAETGSFRTVADWGGGWQRLRRAIDGGTRPLNKLHKKHKHLLDKSEAVFSEMLASSSQEVLLHGDLHHQNILCAGGDRWVVIDPKGILGEPEYEAGAWMRNPAPLLASSPSIRKILAARISILSERLGFDKERIRAWAFSQAVLAAIWAFEDHGAGWEPFMAVAEALESMNR